MATCRPSNILLLGEVRMPTRPGGLAPTRATTMRKMDNKAPIWAGKLRCS